MVQRLAACTCVLALSVTGCAVAGKSFSMDSMSRTPFFGLSLQPKGPDKSESIHRSISRETTSSVPTETADLKRRNASGWKGWWPGATQAKAEPALPMQAIPLPRTDLTPLSENVSGKEVDSASSSSSSPF
jgi:hypothetical protein